MRLGEWSHVPFAMASGLPPYTYHAPLGSIPTGTMRYRSRSMLSMTARAECCDTARVSERPPNSTAMTGFWVFMVASFGVVGQSIVPFGGLGFPIAKRDENLIDLKFS